MKTIRVAAAVITAKNEKGDPIIFATQRGYGDLKGGWIRSLLMRWNGCQQMLR